MLILFFPTFVSKVILLKKNLIIDVFLSLKSWKNLFVTARIDFLTDITKTQGSKEH